MKQDSMSIGVVQEVGQSVVNQQLKKQLLRGGVSHTVIGPVSALGAVNVSMRKPGSVKKRRVVGAKKRKGTRGCCCCYTKRNYSWPFCVIHQRYFRHDGCISPTWKDFIWLWITLRSHSCDVVDPYHFRNGLYTTIPPLHIQLNSTLLRCFGKCWRIELEERNWQIQKHFLQE